jgi:hypothetical protein
VAGLLVQLNSGLLWAQVAVPADSAGADAGDGLAWLPLVRRWFLFGLVVALLIRRVFSFFQDRENDEFATMSAAYRWVFPFYLSLLAGVAWLEFAHRGNVCFSLSILALAFSVRRYYCEGDFANHPMAQWLHLMMRITLILVSLFSLPVSVWALAAFAPIAFSLFYNHEDLASHRHELMFFLYGFLGLGLLGALAGHLLPVPGSVASQTGLRVNVGAALFIFPLLAYFIRWLRRVMGQAVGGFIYDLVFSEGNFAEPAKRPRHLPDITLLRHWRDCGEMGKAWRVARSHLFQDLRALPVWLFALETAILYRRRPEEAIKLLRRACDCEAFPHDHRMAVVGQVREWMIAAGFPFNAAAFRVDKPVLDPSGVGDQVEYCIRQGRFRQAESLLRAQLARDQLNEQAFTQLVRLRCQDMKDRVGAERLIARAEDTFGPQCLDFLRGSLDDWIKMPVRCTLRPQSFWDRFRPRRRNPDPSQSIAFNSEPNSSPDLRAADPLESYLQRLKEAKPPIPDTSLVTDRAEKLLLERRLGTAVALLKEQAEAAPANFELWLRYAEAQGNHCGNILVAERIIQRMERSGNFKKSQLRKAHNQLTKWRKKHPHRRPGW